MHHFSREQASGSKWFKCEYFVKMGDFNIDIKNSQQKNDK